MLKWLIILAACFLIVMYVEQVPAQNCYYIGEQLFCGGTMCVEIDGQFYC